MTLPGAEPFSPELETKLREAQAAKGPTYRPRTHHLEPDGSPTFTNRLIFETSPYLLQHAHNPVNWYPWGEEAFEAARRLGKPVLLSVGYSTCHWCHVMEGESFEDVEIAAYLNQHFIPIKVDREERPDVDGVYMTAVQIMTGGGGWPMTVALTPDRRPFFGGTYFPPRDGARGARVGFLTILKRLQEVYAKEHNRVLENAEQLSQAVHEASVPQAAAGVPKADALVKAAVALARRYDPRSGGFGGAPKFPRPSTFDLLLRFWRRTKDPHALEMVTHSLDRMYRGGIYDQIGGGFHRYSTDDEWLVPHFEKMLYDNAQLVVTYLETHQASGDVRFAEAARDVLAYVSKEMTSPEGAFYSATDADSEGHEGRFFVWTAGELTTVLGAAQAKIVSSYYSVSAEGNFEGRSILHRPRADAEVAKELKISEDELRSQLKDARKKLYEAREKRIHPLLDDKIITEWNGQMISAFAKAAEVLGDQSYAERAGKAADLVLHKLRVGGRLLRTHRAGMTKHHAVLEDYAFLIAGLLDLFEATGKHRWLEEAIGLQAVLESYHLDGVGGGFYTAPSDVKDLLVRDKPTYDGAQPSGNSIAVLNLLRLFELTDREHYRTTAEAALRALATTLDNGALAAPKLATALDYYLDQPRQIALVRSKGDDGAALLSVIRKTFLPSRVLVMTEEGEDAHTLGTLIPWIHDKRAIQGKATAYVCTRGVCLKPTSSPDELAESLAKVEPLATEVFPLKGAR
jgi:uncharacterized protein